MTTESGLVSANLDLLRQGSDLIRRLPDAGYGTSAGEAAPVGPHFRHVIEHYSCFLAGRAAGHEALAGRIESQVNAIIAACKLPPAADANLHYVIADLLRGASLMRGQDPERSRHDGAALVHGALGAYGQYFDDPSFAR